MAIGIGVLAHVRQDASVARRKHLHRAAAEGFVLVTNREQAAVPIQQRMRVMGLGLDVHRLVAVERVHDRRQHQALRVGTREAAVAVWRPLHGRTYAVTVAQVDVVTHAQFVAVIQRGRARHGQQQAGQQLDTAAVAL